jgi:hypothetical protein
MPRTTKIKRQAYAARMAAITSDILAQDSATNEETFDICTDNRLREEPEMARLLNLEAMDGLTSAEQALLDSRRAALRPILVELYREWPLPFVRRLP